MKEAIAWAFVGLVQLGLIWIALIAAALILGRGRARLILAVLAFLSVPAYVVVSTLWNEVRMAAHWDERTRIAQENSAAYREICARPQELKTLQVVKATSPVDLRVREAARIFTFDAMQPLRPAKTVCWADASQPRCATPHIANVQWEFVSTASWCQDGRAETENCYIAWNQSVETGARIRTKSLTAPYALEISSPTKVSALIERYEVYVMDDNARTLLGQATIYRKSWFGDIGRTVQEEQEPRHCPDRDGTIGRLLESVFPQP